MLGLFKKKITFTVTIIVEPDDARFHAYCPALKGLHVEGSTKEEACQNARDASIAYIESLIKHGDPLPLSVVVQEEPLLSMISDQSQCIHQVPITI